MKKILVIAALSLQLCSCSSLSKSKTYGAITGALACGVLGTYAGGELSPNQASRGFNKVIGGVSGAGICAVGGYLLGKYLYESDPRNFEDTPIDFEKRQDTPKQEVLSEDFGNLSFSDLSLEQDYERKIPIIKNLPQNLKEKVKRQKVIHYRVKPQTITTKDGRTIYFSGGEAIEHRYISSKGE